MKDNGYAIPVVMYHTVGRDIPDWKWSFLTVPARIFEDHLRLLVKDGYQTVDLDQLYLHVTGEHPLPARSVVLTFDDGYLDNWTYVAPLLKRHGCKGTVFVNPDFVDPSEVIRPTLDDLWAGRVDEKDVPVRGFMSWPELRHLDQHGPLRVEAHAMTHTWYPVGPKIVDFHHPDSGYYWLDWNASPANKPYYLIDPRQSVVPWGTPVYEHQKSLAARRYFPDSEEGQLMAEFIEWEGGPSFFSKQNWRELLYDRVEEMRRQGLPHGTFETDEEQVLRYRFELGKCKDILEQELRRTPRFLCWPGGGYNEMSRTLALEYYAAVTLGSADLSPCRNRPAEDPRLIKRIGVPSVVCKGRHVYPGGRYFVNYLKEYQGDRIARRCRQLQKALILGFNFCCNKKTGVAEK